jgi:hypothetical protein
LAVTRTGMVDDVLLARTRLPERFGQTCNVLARGRMNNCLVVFADGYKVVTSRNFVRRLKGK